MICGKHINTKQKVQYSTLELYFEYIYIIRVNNLGSCKGIFKYVIRITASHFFWNVI